MLPTLTEDSPCIDRVAKVKRIGVMEHGSSHRRAFHRYCAVVVHNHVTDSVPALKGVTMPACRNRRPYGYLHRAGDGRRWISEAHPVE